MPNYRQFDAACAALRQLRQKHFWTPPSEPRANADGSFVHDDAGDEASSLGLDALRVVLQHTCQADCEMLSARRDCPDQCYVVTCDVNRREFWLHGDHFYKDIYSPALTSRENAWRLCAEIAHDTKENTPYPDSYEVEYIDYGDGYSYEVSTANSFSNFGVATYDLRGGTIEDAETFLDLRTLAAARVVVGLDTLSGQMLNAVVKLRETKMPRTLYFEDPGDCWDDCFEFTDLRVYKSAAGFEVDNFEFQVYPAEVLKSAAELAVHWPKPRVGDIISWDYTLTPAAPDLHQFMKMVRGQKNDTIASYRELRDVAGEEVSVDVAIRPLALAAEANRVVRWDKGVRTFVRDAIARFPKFPITIKPLGGEDVVVRVRSTLTIYQVKGMLEDSLPWAPVCPASQLALLFKNRRLDDDRTIACYDIQKGSTLHVRLAY